MYALLFVTTIPHYIQYFKTKNLIADTIFHIFYTCTDVSQNIHFNNYPNNYIYLYI